MRQTTIVNREKANKKWFVVDAENQVVGRLAAFVASVLRGKTKPTFTPNADMGDYVIIINAEKAIFTAKKEEDKVYYHHSGYPGGLKSITAAKLRAKKPTAIVEKAIYGMLPHTKLGNKQRRNLFVVAGPEHKYAAQKPERLEVR
ncbi:50S ribosomal protein L13 [Mycoplasmopsis agalactiae 14628]|uniref:Large ribosomal subunit protein uL13 n=2 Tax=Mycoplasmopsis agalactiae TaxID=2110 RepID=I5D6U4_MYCAA|nr:50S ribosomal protein L13 [Mycoplasmopsis agalactiae]EIN15403.1 50S ribosomal protein L13 [Mycoplasmopsis agalactiae 14628]KAB6718573.1 50S ribosomal protein L13 [Mycoplasmopsis agalactiae]MCE6056445.1 50S ribosomal protein L13 [Mycoplasmopsis agalactiae]MCE6061713.1 50S ribosomal protein L13 [Mycoplasmopsis agalactiae]MCE6115300.1 50S ribosomal protein L13 [Mycoplasmopsis agalactiae]